MALKGEVMNAKWDPNQYNKFKIQRSKPFYDLMSSIQKIQKLNTIIDLGCGTGELSRELFDNLNPKHMLAIDSSMEMLAESGIYKAEGLDFKLQDISQLNPGRPVDLIFSNAALQWVPGHELLFPKILNWISIGGQVAIQMPYNFDHPSHQLARDISDILFPEKIKALKLTSNMLTQERYSEILYNNKFQMHMCRIEVYGHPMASGLDVIEWAKGTLLTAYRASLTETEYEKFFNTYKSELLNLIGDGPYFYAFKRLMLWGVKND